MTSPAGPPGRPPQAAAAVSAEFTAKPAVARYAATLDDLPAADRDQRLAVLADFARYVDRDPDVMISEVFDTQARKYKKRGFYTEAAKAFAAGYDEPRNAQLRRSNIIRAFFIANGRRLLPEVPDWMTG